jgi:hypothetical protein
VFLFEGAAGTHCPVLRKSGMFLGQQEEALAVSLGKCSCLQRGGPSLRI